MVSLLGRNLNPYKRAWYALQTFEGVGLATAKRICDQVCIHPLAKVRELREAQLVRLKEIIQPMLEGRRRERLLRIKQAKTRPVPIQPK